MIKSELYMKSLVSRLLLPVLQLSVCLSSQATFGCQKILNGSEKSDEPLVRTSTALPAVRLLSLRIENFLLHSEVAIAKDYDLFAAGGVTLETGDLNITYFKTTPRVFLPSAEPGIAFSKRFSKSLLVSAGCNLKTHISKSAVISVESTIRKKANVQLLLSKKFARIGLSFSRSSYSDSTTNFLIKSAKRSRDLLNQEDYSPVKRAKHAESEETVTDKSVAEVCSLRYVDVTSDKKYFDLLATQMSEIIAPRYGSQGEALNKIAQKQDRSGFLAYKKTS